MSIDVSIVSAPLTGVVALRGTPAGTTVGAVGVMAANALDSELACAAWT
jgi:hypothetical protein